jgi:protein-tyrosine-phosphatase
MPDAPDVLFVCQHGAAKSVIAARHLTELAHARGLAITTAAAGVDPYASIPAPVIAGLRNDGVDDHDAPPQALTRELLENARVVVSFGCDLSAITDDPGRIVQWHDVPQVSDGYDAARTAILSRLQAILDDELPNAAPRPSPGVLRP